METEVIEPKAKTKKTALENCEKSFSVSREKDGWYFITNFIDGDKVVKKEKVGPTMRAIVVDEFKIEVQRFLERME